MHPGGLLSHREADVGVGQDESVFCAGPYEGQVIAIGAVETMGTQHSSPGSMVCADADVEFTKDDQLIRLRHIRQDVVQVHLEFVPCSVRADHRGNIDTDDGGEFAPKERQAEADQAIFDALRQTGQSSRDVVPDGKEGVRVPSLCPGAIAPEEGVTGTHLLQLTLLGEPGLTMFSDVHTVVRQFPRY
ncbi:hypothetical protein SprV_0602145800 [Sparganum proliferum]